MSTSENSPFNEVDVSCLRKFIFAGGHFIRFASEILAQPATIFRPNTSCRLYNLNENSNPLPLLSLSPSIRAALLSLPVRGAGPFPPTLSVSPPHSASSPFIPHARWCPSLPPTCAMRMVRIVGAPLSHMCYGSAGSI